MERGTGKFGQVDDSGLEMVFVIMASGVTADHDSILNGIHTRLAARREPRPSAGVATRRGAIPSDLVVPLKCDRG